MKQRELKTTCVGSTIWPECEQLTTFKECTPVHAERQSEMTEQVPQSTERVASEGTNVIRVDYLKSTLFRAIHVDGAWGGITPTGSINLVLYSERAPIPKQSSYKVAEDGTLSELREMRVARDVVAIREVEVSAVLNEAVAIHLRDWLSERIEQLQQFKEAKVEEGRSG
jgi:hypothetical protein